VPIERVLGRRHETGQIAPVVGVLVGEDDGVEGARITEALQVGERPGPASSHTVVPEVHDRTRYPLAAPPAPA